VDTDKAKIQGRGGQGVDGHSIKGQTQTNHKTKAADFLLVEFYK